jgi:hypothetical protein
MPDFPSLLTILTPSFPRKLAAFADMNNETAKEDPLDLPWRWVEWFASQPPSQPASKLKKVGRCGLQDR